ncbi:hypothetical protein GOBAR_AA36884 [Gossypium barbadense]|uniref:Uncharacterized protein n=1 Tax=Gossypium barbadense TaxID=3634 RepID=A0A2P5VYB4_GOSBA|nr:hypothetical protein GOBAR_AA36884 [Gossypium barbadense]
MSNTQGKSKVTAHSKKIKATKNSSSSSSIDHHRHLTFDHPTHEERYQHLRDRALGLGQYIIDGNNKLKEVNMNVG